MNVSLFITCFNDTLFPQTGRATVNLLERLGHSVDFPEENADTSMAMLSDKLRNILDTHAEVCAAADNSCIRNHLLLTSMLVVPRHYQRRSQNT